MIILGCSQKVVTTTKKEIKSSRQTELDFKQHQKGIAGKE
nr:MAG TPA: hypothetical protein [Caudoviricetes sp.]